MPKQGLALGVVIATAACTSMRSVVPAQFIPQHRPALVSVWTAPDDVTIVSDPKIEGDTLIGVVFEEPWAVPLKDIVKVEAEAPDAGRTVLLVAGSAVSAVGIVYLISSGNGSTSALPCQPSLGCDGVKTAP